MKDQQLEGKRYRLAVLTSHPIQYQAPLWRKLAQHPQIDLMVFFCSDYGARERFDPSFGLTFKWNIPLLDGYPHEFLRNLSPNPGLHNRWGLINIGIVKELWKHRYDALFIHGHSYVTHLIAVLVARLTGIPVLLRSESNLLGESGKRNKLFKHVFYKIIDVFMAIGKLNREYYNYYGISKDRIFHMPYAVDNEWFFRQWELYSFRKEEIKKELGLAPKSKIVLYVAKFIMRKRPMDVIKAFERLDVPDVALVMIGDGAERPSCSGYVRKHNIKNVYFLGFENQSELPKYYAIADVFVLPSQDEPWGLVINEAMCFGVPVIATDRVGGAVDLVIPNQTGYIYSAGDIDQLTFYLKLFLGDDTTKFRRSCVSHISRCSFSEDIEGLLAALEKVA